MSNIENLVEERIENPFSDMMSENQRLREMLDEAITMRKRAEARLADLEEKCQELAAENENLKYRLSCCQDEEMVLQAQMEVVHLIFGGNKCGGCG